MDKRGFFKSLTGLSAIPLVGVARVVGAIEKPEAPPPFGDGTFLTAKALNDQFDYIKRRLDLNG